MIISLNWLKKLTPIDASIDEVVRQIGSKLVEVESVVDLGKKYEKVIVAKVVSCVDHEDSDHLHICKIDDGGVAREVERNDDGTITVVCGANNIRAGLTVAWLPPGSIVPETFDTNEPFELGARKLRGVMSNGMIASCKELDLSDEHEGILELPFGEAGDKLADILELNDYLIEVENKSLTHRPDCFGLLGFAREVAVIFGGKLKNPEWFNAFNNGFSYEKNSELTIKIEDEKLCPKYTAAIVEGISQNEKSDILTQTYLSRSGMRAVNKIVDIANKIMLETGQPLHTFDYDKVVKLCDGKIAEIVVRGAKKGEKIELLDKKTIELDEGEIIICAGKIPIALAGAMGGANTEIDENTTKILIESASFDLYKLRNTQMKHGIFSEAITRFTKGIPTQLCGLVLLHAVKEFGAKQVGEAVGYPEIEDIQDIEKIIYGVHSENINSLLGANYEKDEIKNILENLGYSKCNIDHKFQMVSPWWRTDLHIWQDAAEDVGRIMGFDEITKTLPKLHGAETNKFDDFRNELRNILADKIGVNETLNYSFVNGDLFDKTGRDKKTAFKIVNAISPDLQYYRTDLTTSLLAKVNKNIRNGFNEFAIFEIGKTHDKQEIGDDNLPIEDDRLAVVVANSDEKTQTAFFVAKQILQKLLKNNKIIFEKTTKENNFSPYEPKRSAIIKIGDSKVGIVGEFIIKTQRELKLPKQTAGFELDLNELYKVYNNKINYKPIAKFPGTTKDICFQTELNYSEIYKKLKSACDEESLNIEIKPLDIYQKNISFHLSLNKLNETITANEANGAIERIIKKVGEKTV